MTLSTSAVAVCCCKDFAKFAEETRVFDGDHRLRRETRQQINLLVGKWRHLFTVDRERTNELTVLEHGHIEDRPELPKIDRRDKYGFALDIGGLLGDIGDMNRLSGLSNTPQSGACTRSLRSTVPKIGKCRRYPEHGGSTPCSIVVPKQHSKSGAAHLHRILQHRLEYRVKLAGRTADDLEHVRGGCLLLQ